MESKISEKSIVEMIDYFLEIVRDAPIYLGFRRDLEAIKESIWLELPEYRQEYLCRIGRSLNRHVPSNKDNSYREDFWYEIRDILQEAFQKLDSSVWSDSN